MIRLFPSDMNEKKQRTIRQNASLHLMFDQMASILNDHGAYIPKVIKMDAKWDKDRVKELIWKPTQETLFETRSTTKLTTKQIDEVFEVIHQALANIGVEIQFPSIETQLMNQRTLTK